MTHIMIYKDIQWLSSLNSQMKLPGKSITFTHQRNPRCLWPISKHRLDLPELRQAVTGAPCGEGTLWSYFSVPHFFLFLYHISLHVSTYLPGLLSPLLLYTLLSPPSPLRSWSRAANYFPNFLFPKAKSNRLGQWIFPCFGRPWIFLRIIMNFRVSVRKRLPFN